MKSSISYKSIYNSTYDYSNTERTLSGRFLQKSHALLEDNLPVEDKLDHILEVGSGTGNHFSFLNQDYSTYTMTDGSDEMLEIARHKYKKEATAGKIIFEHQDATSLTYPNDKFDRLIGTHVLEHLNNPVSVLTEWNRVVRPGGVISIVLPCDPGLLWRFGCHLGPRQNAKKLGYDYDFMIASEHINSIFNLVILLRHYFEIIVEKWYPLGLALPDVNLFYICHIRVGPDQLAN